MTSEERKAARERQQAFNAFTYAKTAVQNAMSICDAYLSSDECSTLRKMSQEATAILAKAQQVIKPETKGMVDADKHPEGM